MLTTTLHAIREHNPCTDRWKHLLTGLGLTRANRKPLPLERIFEICGLDDALWALRAVEGHDGALRLYACYCARYVLDIFERNYPEDARPRHAIETAERFARGEATIEELDTAKAAAWNARGAWDAAAWAAARYAAEAAARYAAEAAAGVAAEYASSIAEIDAWDTAWAAESAASNAARVAASDAVYAAGAAAWAAAWADFQREFIRLCRLEGEYGEVDTARRASFS